MLTTMMMVMMMMMMMKQLNYNIVMAYGIVCSGFWQQHTTNADNYKSDFQDLTEGRTFCWRMVMWNGCNWWSVGAVTFSPVDSTMDSWHWSADVRASFSPRWTQRWRGSLGSGQSRTSKKSPRWLAPCTALGGDDLPEHEDLKIWLTVSSGRTSNMENALTDAQLFCQRRLAYYWGNLLKIAWQRPTPDGFVVPVTMLDVLSWPQFK